MVAVVCRRIFDNRASLSHVSANTSVGCVRLERSICRNQYLSCVASLSRTSTRPTDVRGGGGTAACLREFAAAGSSTGSEHGILDHDGRWRALNGTRKIHRMRFPHHSWKGSGDER